MCSVCVHALCECVCSVCVCSVCVCAGGLLDALSPWFSSPQVALGCGTTSRVGSLPTWVRWSSSVALNSSESSTQTKVGFPRASSGCTRSSLFPQVRPQVFWGTSTKDRGHPVGRWFPFRSPELVRGIQGPPCTKGHRSIPNTQQGPVEARHCAGARLGARTQAPSRNAAGDLDWGSHPSVPPFPSLSDGNVEW